MGYKKISLRNGLLLVEKYYDVVDYEDIISADEEAYAIEIPVGQQFLVLADLSEATFPNITNEQIDNLFKVIDEFAATTNGMKHALYTGSMEMESFNKTHQYLEIAAQKALSMVPFSHIDLAYEWLEFTNEERAQINTFLFK